MTKQKPATYNTCWSCGKRLGPEQLICPKCRDHRFVAKERECPSCGKPTFIQDKECPECGADMEA